MSDLTSARLTELLRMRRFLDVEIAAERQRLVDGDYLSILRAAADLYAVTADDVVSLDQSGPVVRARHMACWLLRERGYTYVHIGQILNRDHSTAIYGWRAIDRDPARRALGVQLLAQEDAA